MARQVWLACIAALLLLASSAVAEEAKPVSGEELKEKVKENIEAQDYLREASKVVAQVIKQEPAAELASGTGDVASTGKCTDDLDLICPEVKPGEGRLAKCLSDQLAEEAKKDYKGDNRVSPECKKELDAFLVDRSQNINKDLPLAEACKGDVEKYCADLEGEISILGCLRENKPKITTACSDEVFQRQVVAVDDWRTDKELAAACKGDVEKFCATTDPHEGKVQECLQAKDFSLDWECKAQLFRQQTENADDLRLSVRLFRACLGDKRKFCADVAPGNTRAKDCLEDHREDPAFSAECKKELESMMTERAADFRLDFKLKELCEQDIEELCEYEREENVADTRSKDAPVIRCLQDFREDIVSPSCKARVLKLMEYAASDIRFDVPLAEACFEDRQSLCGGVPPGSARVIRCLQDKRMQLTDQCKAVLFDQEVVMAENIDFQFAMKKNCSKEITKLCPDVTQGRAKVIRCLEESLSSPDMGAACKAEVEKHIQHSSQDFRLNYRLDNACRDTIAEHCSEACPSMEDMDGQVCGGAVLHCLRDMQENITDADCKKEVFYFIKMEVKDFRNDVLLAEACRQDVQTFCDKIQPGEGRVLACLADNRPKLSPACRKEEISLSVLQASNVELMPSLGTACKTERNDHCKGVRPGKARVLNCLLTNANPLDYSLKCTVELKRQQERRVRDWRLDYDLRTACRGDVPKLCAGAKSQEDNDNAAIFKCLVSTAAGAESGSLSEPCLREVSRAARTTLQFYQPKLPVTDVCDSDVVNACLQEKALDDYGVGNIRKCLKDLGMPAPPPMVEGPTGEDLTQGRNLAEKAAKKDLSPACKALVMLAEPVDEYNAYKSSLTLNYIAQNAKAIENAFGWREGLLATKGAGQTGLTLTGWSALLGLMSVILVALAAGVWGYCKYRGLDKMSGYTMVVKGKGVPSAT